MQCSNLTDDELWRAIAKNTKAMSGLFNQAPEAGTGVLHQTSAKFATSRAIDNLERQYQDYAAEFAVAIP